MQGGGLPTHPLTWSDLYATHPTNGDLVLVSGPVPSKGQAGKGHLGGEQGGERHPSVLEWWPTTPVVAPQDNAGSFVSITLVR